MVRKKAWTPILDPRLSPKPNKLLIAGGGTGGHVLAGIAVADEWKSSTSSSEVFSAFFVGAQGGIEEKLVPRAGYTLATLGLGSLNRVSFSRKLKTLIQLPLAFITSLRILLREKTVDSFRRGWLRFGAGSFLRQNLADSLRDPRAKRGTRIDQSMVRKSFAQNILRLPWRLPRI